MPTAHHPGDGAKVHVQFQRHWRLAAEKGKSLAEGFTSVAKAEQWAREQGLEVDVDVPVAKPGKPKPSPPSPL